MNGTLSSHCVTMWPERSDQCAEFPWAHNFYPLCFGTHVGRELCMASRLLLVVVVLSTTPDYIGQSLAMGRQPTEYPLSCRAANGFIYNTPLGLAFSPWTEYWIPELDLMCENRRGPGSDALADLAERLLAQLSLANALTSLISPCSGPQVQWNQAWGIQRTHDSKHF